jgi:hypothetical protein
MTALAAPMVNGHDSGAETGTEHSPSRFTAVNGREPVPGNGVTPNFIADRGLPEKSSLEASQRDNQPRENLDLDQDKISLRSPSPGNSHKNKRKRSESRERDSSTQGVNASNSPVSRPAEIHAHPNGSAAGSVAEMERGNHSATPSHRSEGNDVGQTSANSPWSEYDSQLINQAQRAQQMDVSDAHLADALQREAGQERSANRSTPGAQPSSPGYVQDRHGAMHVAPKRKRVFSNRTKTGCMTCRRRKKKCDEQHPACKSIPGGFRNEHQERMLIIYCRQQLSPGWLFMRGVFIAKHLAEAIKCKDPGPFTIQRRLLRYELHARNLASSRPTTQYDRPC